MITEGSLVKGKILGSRKYISMAWSWKRQKQIFPPKQQERIFRFEFGASYGLPLKQLSFTARPACAAKTHHRMLLTLTFQYPAAAAYVRDYEKLFSRTSYISDLLFMESSQSQAIMQLSDNGIGTLHIHTFHVFSNFHAQLLGFKTYLLAFNIAIIDFENWSLNGIFLFRKCLAWNKRWRLPNWVLWGSSQENKNRSIAWLLRSSLIEGTRLSHRLTLWPREYAIKTIIRPYDHPALQWCSLVSDVLWVSNPPFHPTLTHQNTPFYMEFFNARWQFGV